MPEELLSLSLIQKGIIIAARIDHCLQNADTVEQIPKRVTQNVFL